MTAPTGGLSLAAAMNDDQRLKNIQLQGLHHPRARNGSALPEKDEARGDSGTDGRVRPPQRVVMVSNRVADGVEAPSGGLAVALSESMSQSEDVWFGWSGRICDNPGSEPAIRRYSGGLLATIDLTEKEHADYYCGFANQCLWPLLHYRPDLVRFSTARYEGYRSVCSRFADGLQRMLKPADLLWVHDFHLLGLGAELRRRGVNSKIGFFLHVPFPPAEVLAALPLRDLIFDDLFSYDLVGVQTKSDLACLRGYAASRNGLRDNAGDGEGAARRLLKAQAYPIGIDAQAYSAVAARRNEQNHVERVRAIGRGRALVLGVDRLDYTKGLPERFAAYRQFLLDNPDQGRRTLLLQITPPTRTDLDPYQKIQAELDRMEGAIHGEFADIDCSPIRYIKRQLPRRTLAALYRAARIGLVTPLRDGMNLVAKEYIAAQDESDPGVLILSCFAGAAETLTEAIVVNPLDYGAVSAALSAGLAMAREERRERHAALLQKIKLHDVHEWRRRFLADLMGGEPHPSADCKSLCEPATLSPHPVARYPGDRTLTQAAE